MTPFNLQIANLEPRRVMSAHLPRVGELLRLPDGLAEVTEVVHLVDFSLGERVPFVPLVGASYRRIDRDRLETN